MKTSYKDFYQAQPQWFKDLMGNSIEKFEDPKTYSYTLDELRVLDDMDFEDTFKLGGAEGEDYE